MTFAWREFSVTGVNVKFIVSKKRKRDIRHILFYTYIDIYRYQTYMCNIEEIVLDVSLSVSFE